MAESGNDISVRRNSSGFSTRDLADLARAGHEMLRKPDTRVEFVVHHTADRPGYLRDTVLGGRDLTADAQAGFDECPAVIETMASAANGVGLVLGTNTGVDLPPLGGYRRQDSFAAGLIADEPTRKVFRGSAVPNPTFLYESAATYQGIVSVDPAPRSVKFYQSLAVRDLIEEISRIAANVANAPLLFLQSPAQLPAQSFIGEDVRSAKITASRRSSSLAVRFGIALHEPSAKLRFELSDKLRRYCGERGFGLWLADSRVGYRTGNWFQICPPADDLSRRDRRELAASVDWRAVEACLPVTFIGPARTGSTYSIMSFLSQFNDVGIISCANTALDDLAFIHLQLSFTGVRRSCLRELNSRLAGQSAWATDPGAALVYVHERLTGSAGGVSGHVLAGELSEHAGDYQTLVGPMLGCAVPDQHRRMTVWVSWQMEGAVEDLATPLRELFTAFSNIGFGPGGPGGPGRAGRPGAAEAGNLETDIPNLEYLICRDIGNSVLRGRGKLSVPEADMLKLAGGNDVEGAAAKLCVGIEKAWKTSLARRGARGASELTVAWREWWLGHWSSPI
jgi:hypothetical protein